MTAPRLEGRAIYLDVRPPGTDDVVQFKATNLTMERTGVHAQVEIYANSIRRAWGIINVSRDEDRVRLVNKAVKLFPTTLNDAWPTVKMQKDLDDFCFALWGVWIGQFEPKDMKGALERKAPTYLVERLILAGGGSILFSPPGRGKSYTAMLLTQSINTATCALFGVPSPRRVTYVNLERSQETLVQRLGNVNAALDLPRDTEMRMINARGKSLFDVRDALARDIEERGTEFMCLDSISRAGYGKLVEDAPANRIMDDLNNLCPAWLAIAHTPRTDETHTYGSQMFDAAADVTVQLVSDQEEDSAELLIGLKVGLANDQGKQGLIGLRLTFDELGLTRAFRASGSEVRSLSGLTKTSLALQVKEYLLQVGPTSATDVAEELGAERSAVSRLLSNNGRFIRAEKRGKSVLYAVKETHRV